MRPSTFERARRAVLDQMGWEDDRTAEEYPGECWDLAGEIAEAVAVELAAKANPGGGRVARWRLACARQLAPQGAPP